MPHPEKGESMSSYISRFMGSKEAKGDFPKKKQRLAVAYNLFKKRKKKRA
jgi:hypothetical protein